MIPFLIWSVYLSVGDSIKSGEGQMSLKPDITVLQESSEKDIDHTEAPFKHWVGCFLYVPFLLQCSYKDVLLLLCQTSKLLL